jgi:flagellar protein FlaG
MNIQPTPASPPISIQIKKSVVEGALEKMVRVRDTSRIEKPSSRIVEPPEINGANIGLQFAVDSATGERVVKILDKQTGEVIRQVPPEELLNVMQSLRALKGLLLSTKS